MLEKNNYQNNIKQFRVREGLTQEELAKKINISRQMIDHKKPLEPQGLGVVLLLRDFFQKKKHFSERYLFLDIFYY